MGESAAVQARHLSGASIGKLVEWEVGKDVATGAHRWSPAGTLTHVWHGQDSTEISVNHDHPGDYADTLDQIIISPESWVRVTQGNREVLEGTSRYPGPGKASA